MSRVRGPGLWRCLAAALAVLLGLPLAGTVHAQSPEPAGAPAANRIWGLVFTKGGEAYAGFLRFVSARHSANWADSFQAEQSVGDEPFRAWANAFRDGAPSVRTVELKGYRITWNAGEDDFSSRSGDFPGSRVIRIPYGSLADLKGQPPRGPTLFLSIGLRAPGTNDGEAPRKPEHVWSGAGRGLILRYTEEWRSTTIEVEGLDGAHATVAFRDVESVSFDPPPDAGEPPSAPLFGTAVDRSGRSFTGFVNLNGDIVVESDILEGWLDGQRSRSIPLDGVRAVERVTVETGRGPSEGLRLTLAAGEVVELTPGRERRGSSIAVAVTDPGFGTVTIDWQAFSALHLHDPGGDAVRSAGCQGDRVGLAPTAFNYDTFGGGTPLRGTVVTGTGEAYEGRIRWGTMKEWSWDLLHGAMDGAELAVRFANIRSIERMVAPDPPPDPARTGTAPRGRIRVNLLDGRTCEMSVQGDVGPGDAGILVRPADDGTDEDRSGWRLIGWQDVRIVRFEHPGRQGPGS